MSKPLPKSRRPYWMGERPTHSWSKAKHYKFLKSAAWEKAALAHKMQNPWCVMCLDEGIYTPVQETDHIVEVRDGGALLDFNNMQSLCKRHHLIKSNAERRKRANKNG